MKIAELFVSLGVKGGDSAGKALKGVKSGLGEVKSMGLETKAMIAAVVYGLEKMMSNSAQAGTDLKNFTLVTGMSAKNLQQWQFAARQAGVSGEELTGSLKAVQNTMTNMLVGKGMPEGYKSLVEKTGFDPKHARDTFYGMQKLQELAKSLPPDIGGVMVKSFGVSEGTFAAMREGVFNEKNFKKAPIYSDKEFGSLSKVGVAWSNLGQKIQMAFGHMTAKDGLKIVHEIDAIANSVIKLIGNLNTLADKWKLFQVAGNALTGIANTVKLIAEMTDTFSGKKSKKGDLLHHEGELFPGLGDSPAGKLFKALMGSETAAPPVDKSKIAVPYDSRNLTVNQNLNFQHDGKDAKKTAGSVHKAVKDAYWSMSAQGQGT